ncbi:hypothetical protein CCAX7_61730 [Capsulimonas corticalis]|uniref:Uncharacterized protein n=1 Tax=Capsulimonas corticalis TaxID=2219043 RepID=A0A402CWE9_9BACT|nr:hypothetical protein [Capsulimonas corticalis]BDI34122.1 hypothetical protein CCAX7_61730 [Capsulimonas corticalis]
MSEPVTIKLFVDNEHEHGFGHETKVREVIAFLLEGGEGFLFLEDAEEPLDIEISLGEIGIKHHGNVHVARCRKIHVTVDYAARSHSREFTPNKQVKAVKDWAVSLDWSPNNIDPAERPKFGLFLPDDKEPLSDSRPIGTLIPKGDCECNVTLELAPRVRPQG